MSSVALMVDLVRVVTWNDSHWQYPVEMVHDYYQRENWDADQDQLLEISGDPEWESSGVLDQETWDDREQDSSHDRLEPSEGNRCQGEV